MAAPVGAPQEGEGGPHPENRPVLILDTVTKESLAKYLSVNHAAGKGSPAGRPDELVAALGNIGRYAGGAAAAQDPRQLLLPPWCPIAAPHCGNRSAARRVQGLVLWCPVAGIQGTSKKSKVRGQEEASL